MLSWYIVCTVPRPGGLARLKLDPQGHRISQRRLADETDRK